MGSKTETPSSKCKGQKQFLFLDWQSPHSTRVPACLLVEKVPLYNISKGVGGSRRRHAATTAATAAVSVYIRLIKWSFQQHMPRRRHHTAHNVVFSISSSTFVARGASCHNATHICSLLKLSELTFDYNMAQITQHDTCCFSKEQSQPQLALCWHQVMWRKQHRADKDKSPLLLKMFWPNW